MCVTRQNTSQFVEYFAACNRVFAAICHFEYCEDPGHKVADQESSTEQTSLEGASV